MLKCVLSTVSCIFIEVSKIFSNCRPHTYGCGAPLSHSVSQHVVSVYVHAFWAFFCSFGPFCILHSGQPLDLFCFASDSYSVTVFDSTSTSTSNSESVCDSDSDAGLCFALLCRQLVECVPGCHLCRPSSVYAFVLTSAWTRFCIR